MARVEFASRVAEEFARIVTHLFAHDVLDVAARIAKIESALGVLAEHPAIGRRAGDGRRGLVIAKCASGFLSRYRYVEALDRVLVLAIRAQREQRLRG